MTLVLSPGPVNGILLLNKPEGLSSNGVLQKVKHLFGAKKAGHSGSLDPLATGMLPICFGEATKICQFLLNADKCYQTSGLLGIKTDTADATGTITQVIEDYCVSEQELKSILLSYQGKTKQIPSMYSALKHKGKPLYHYARKGIEIEREARDITISQLQLDDFDGTQFTLTLSCSKGTYVRNLVEDIGDALGVGAHVKRLHRVYTAGFEGFPMYSLEDLQSMSLTEQLNCLIPMDKAVEHLQEVILSDEEVMTIRQGRIVAEQISEEAEDYIRLYNEARQFIGLGERLINGGLKAKRLLSFA